MHKSVLLMTVMASASVPIGCGTPPTDPAPYDNLPTGEVPDAVACDTGADGMGDDGGGVSHGGLDGGGGDSGGGDHGGLDGGTTTDGAVACDASDAGNASDATESSGCTLTQGFWKTHPSAWPVTTLTLGNVMYSEAQLIALMNTAPTGDASLILADQLIAARLNIDSGAGASGTILSTIAAAQSFLAGFAGSLPYNVDPSTPAGNVATSLAATLDAYNNGLSGTPHCN
jgi:hypothetical protein